MILRGTCSYLDNCKESFNIYWIDHLCWVFCVLFFFDFKHGKSRDGEAQRTIREWTEKVNL